MASGGLRAKADLAPATRATRPIVVKLGGSVVRTGELAAWLEAIAAARVPIVVVPGGGALADEVRACQSRLGFGDAAAHRMALLAMDQLAWAVAGLRQGFTVGASEAELRDALARGSVAVWAPYALIAGRACIEQSWRLTSDSLALWLAARIGAARCYLIKSIVRPKPPRLSARQLARDGVVDEAFADMLAETGTPTILLGRGDQGAFAASTAEGEPCGAEIA
jgi:aspartokinase-like uncharacterized kinase